MELDTDVLNVMKVEVIEEAGYEAALTGLSLSYKTVSSIGPVARKLAPKDGGHNKFLESIYVWLDVTAPRYWWQEADTYRLSTKQSESTMHTLMKELEGMEIHNASEFFEPGSILPAQLSALKGAVKYGRIEAVKKLLPEGFLQRRIWVMNYKTLRNIILQRRDHRLPHWQDFIDRVLAQVNHPELLPIWDRTPMIKAGVIEEGGTEVSDGG